MDNSSADKTPNRLKPIEILAPSRSENRPTAPASPTVPTTPTSKRRSAYLINTPRTEALRPELTGADMKGLMNAVGSLPARGAINDEGQGVTGESCIL
jgi:Ras GTPase-activating-like protein IQGAP2/3